MGTVSLRVRRRELLCVDGTVHVAQTVFCPFREVSLPLSSCKDCAYCLGSAVLSEDNKVLICHRDMPVTTDAEFSSANFGDARKVPVRAIMLSRVVCARASLPVWRLARELSHVAWTLLPIVNDDDEVLGTVSLQDVLRQELSTSEALCNAAVAEYDTPQPHNESQTLVRDIMQPIRATVAENASLAQAAAIMAQEALSMLPVVSQENEVVGIISTLDITRWLARHCGYIVSASENVSSLEPNEGEKHAPH